MESNRLSSHIMPTSATMVGVCMTVMSIIKLSSPAIRTGFVDEVLAIDAVVFLASVVASYLSLRQHDGQRAERAERQADRFFIAGMCLMVGAGLWFAFWVA